MATFSSVHDATDHTGITGVGSGALNKYDATVAPTANEDTGDGYSVGSVWVDVTADKIYVCVDASAAAAIWKRLGPVAEDALWDAAGDLLVGTGADAATRLAKGTALQVLRVNSGATALEWAASSGGITSGTSFPGSPADNDLYYRTDLACGLYRYEATGTMWLCSTLHELIPSVRNAIATGGVSATTASMWNTPTLMSAGDMWVEELIGSLFVNTTNTGAAYWTVELNKLTGANAATQIGQLSTISNAADTWVEERVSIGAIVAGSAHVAFRLGVTKVSTPGNIFPNVTVTWRHVVDV